MKISKSLCLILVVSLLSINVKTTEIDDDCERSGLGDCGYCVRIATNKSLSVNSHRCSLCTNGYILDSSKISVRTIYDNTSILFKESCKKPAYQYDVKPSSNLIALIVFYFLLTIIVCSFLWIIYYFCMNKGKISPEFKSRSSSTRYGEIIFVQPAPEPEPFAKLEGDNTIIIKNLSNANRGSPGYEPSTPFQESDSRMMITRPISPMDIEYTKKSELKANPLKKKQTISITKNKISNLD